MAGQDRQLLKRAQADRANWSRVAIPYPGLIREVVDARRVVHQAANPMHHVEEVGLRRGNSLCIVIGVCIASRAQNNQTVAEGMTVQAVFAGLMRGIHVM